MYVCMYVCMLEGLPEHDYVCMAENTYRQDVLRMYVSSDEAFMYVCLKHTYTQIDN